MVLFSKITPREEQAISAIVSEKQAELKQRQIKSRTDRILTEREKLLNKSKKLIDKEAKRRLRITEIKSGFAGTRQKLIEAENKRKKKREQKAGTLLQRATKIFTPFPQRKGLSDFQLRILENERIKRVLRETPPMDRAKRINRGSAFHQQRDIIRSDLAEKRQRSSIVLLEDSKVQQKLAESERKILNS